ncbi:MAG: hypothetical protein WBH44_00135 [Proteocatella sp.]
MGKIEMQGYHATNINSVKSILDFGFNINKKRDNEWLGHGIYFFKYRTDALTWAKNTHYCKGNPTIIKCKLECDEKSFLDLDDPSRLNHVNEFSEEISNLLSEDGETLSFKDDHEKVCAILNIYKQYYGIRLISYTFKNNRTRNANGYKVIFKDYGYNEAQVCATDNDLVKLKEVVEL